MIKPPDSSGLSPKELSDLERSGREAEVKVELLRLGVSRSQILEIVERYSLERIERQLRWLPYRRARKPSSLIVSAIREDFEVPSAALEQQPSNSSSSFIQPENGSGGEDE